MSQVYHHCATMTHQVLLDFFHFFSPSVMTRIQTPDLRIMIQEFYHPATRTQWLLLCLQMLDQVERVVNCCFVNFDQKKSFIMSHRGRLK
jgi:hypothetical protein